MIIFVDFSQFIPIRFIKFFYWSIVTWEFVILQAFHRIVWIFLVKSSSKCFTSFQRVLRFRYNGRKFHLCRSLLFPFAKKGFVKFFYVCLVFNYHKSTIRFLLCFELLVVFLNSRKNLLIFFCVHASCTWFEFYVFSDLVVNYM